MYEAFPMQFSDINHGEYNVETESTLASTFVLMLLTIESPTVELFSALIATAMGYKATATIETDQRIWIQIKVDGTETAAVNSLTQVLLQTCVQFTLERV